MSDSLKKISAISLFVEDVQKSKTFYQDVFGVPVVYQDEVSAVVQFENVLINLLQVSEASALVAPGAVAGSDSGSRFQISIWIDDVDAVCADLESRGVELLTRPTNQKWGMRTATFTDPAGHSWEVAQELAQPEGA